jgi:hypothetical protein
MITNHKRFVLAPRFTSYTLQQQQASIRRQMAITQVLATPLKIPEIAKNQPKFF